jgi:hypothetical protein
MLEYAIAFEVRSLSKGEGRVRNFRSEKSQVPENEPLTFVPLPV